MEMRKFGKTNLETSAVVFGGWFVGGIIIQSSDGAHADTKLTFTGGGMTTGVGLTAGVFYEFSLKKLTMRNNSNAKAKVFWTNSNPGTKLSDTNLQWFFSPK